MGPARDEKVHVDLYGRKWLLRTWDLPFMDARLISAALPVPDGFVVLSRLAPTGLASQTTELVKMAADLAYVTYSGTLLEWRGFLALPSVQPAAFANITLGLETGNGFSYRSPRFEFIAGKELLDIQDKSMLDLSFSYFSDAGRVLWDVAGVSLREDGRSMAMTRVERRPRPPASLPQRFQDEWLDVRTRRRPFDGAPIRDENLTIVSTTVTRAATNPDVSIPADAAVVYQAAYATEPGFSPPELRSLLRSMLDGLRVKEQ